MASLNQIVSELVHSVGQPNNFALRENVKAAIVHTRNELIRHSMTQHGYVDSVLQQRYKVSLISIGDGDIDYPEDFPECCKNNWEVFESFRSCTLTDWCCAVYSVR